MAERREVRWPAATQAIEPWGFATERCHADALLGLQPFALLPTPSRCHIRAFGEVDGRAVELIEYEHSWTDSEGQQHSGDELIAIVAHPWVTGTVAIGIDPRAWSAVQAALDVLFWIPPFTFLKVVQLVNDARSPDREIGSAKVDRRYRVLAASEEAARAAIPSGLGEHLLATNFRGAIELRPGLAIFRIGSAVFDVEGATQTIAHARAIMKCFPRPETAYR